MRSFRDVLDAFRREVEADPMTPSIGWIGRVGDGFACRMSWHGAVVVTARGATRTEASGNAAALYRAALWLCVLKEGRREHQRLQQGGCCIVRPLECQCGMVSMDVHGTVAQHGGP